MAAEFKRLAGQLLSSGEAGRLHARAAFQRCLNPYGDTGGYLELLADEFPDPVHRKQAHSAILTHAAKKAHTQRGMEFLVEPPAKRHMKLLGVTGLPEAEHPFGMALHAVELDGENREAYELLARMPRTSREAGKLVQKGLERMCEAYPDDPFPRLELSALYYEKNAYRKAETVLNEAMKLAPHDRKVVERHVISLLISADRRIRRNKLDLASEDLARAAESATRATLPLVAQKRIIFNMEKRGQLSLFDKEVIMADTDLGVIVEKEAAPLPPVERLRMLAMLILEAAEREPAWGKKVLKKLDGLFRKHARAAGPLTSKQVLALLAPLDKHTASAIRGRLLAGICIRLCPALLKRLDHTDLFTAVDYLVEESLYEVALKEVQKQTGKGDDPLPDFYEVVLSDIVIGEAEGPEVYLDILDRADEKERETLRSVARKFAPHAWGDLRHALETFDFEYLDDDLFDDEDDDFFDDDDDAMLDELLDEFSGECMCPECQAKRAAGEKAGGGAGRNPFTEGLDQLIESTEIFVDEMGLRGGFQGGIAGGSVQDAGPGRGVGYVDHDDARPARPGTVKSTFEGKSHFTHGKIKGKKLCCPVTSPWASPPTPGTMRFENDTWS